MVLGHADSFLITYRDREGANWIACQGLPKELNDFLYETNTKGAYVRSIPRLRVSLGPYNTSFFATDGASYLWLNLPPLLLSALQTRIKDGAWTDKPRLIALGADENFVLLTERHAAAWDLPNYSTLSSMLQFSRSQDCGIEEIKRITMHAYRYHGFVAQSRNGTLLYENLPGWTMVGMHGMEAAVAKDTRAREREVRRPSEFRREWSSRRREMEGKVEGRVAEAEKKTRKKGLLLSLSLSIGPTGIKFNTG